MSSSSSNCCRNRRRLNVALGVFFIFFFLLIGDHVTEGLRLVQVQVPAEVERSRSAVLGCRFDLGSDTLYSVKWYKGGKEFFRVLPKDTPQAQAFEVEGVQVNLDASNQHQVVLENVSIKSEGRYKCEVSAEAPNFQTVFGIANMSIVVPPRDSPLINSPKTTYRIGEEFIANCSAFPSRPAANLGWTIADKPVDKEEMLIRYPVTITDTGLEASVLGLRFRLKEEHFDKKGRMYLICTASVGRMRIDGRTRLNITNTEGDLYPKQRSLILDSRSGAASHLKFCSLKSLGVALFIVITNLLIWQHYG